jgi:hypothetical protein
MADKAASIIAAAMLQAAERALISAALSAARRAQEGVTVTERGIVVWTPEARLAEFEMRLWEECADAVSDLHGE